LVERLHCSVAEALALMKEAAANEAASAPKPAADMNTTLRRAVRR